MSEDNNTELKAQSSFLEDAPIVLDNDEPDKKRQKVNQGDDDGKSNSVDSPKDKSKSPSLEISDSENNKIINEIVDDEEKDNEILEISGMCPYPFILCIVFV